MSTDNRTNEPTEAQVEAAARALWELHARGDDPLWSGGELDYGIKQIYRKDARAALVAAQGAAPQAESNPTSSYISPSLPGMIRNLWKSDPSENSVRTALKLAGDLIQELIDLRAAPVLPSSTVDEDALAEVIREALRDDRLRVAYGAPVNKPQHVVVARAVAEWLKEQGR